MAAPVNNSYMKIITVGSGLPKDTEHLVIVLGVDPVMYFFQRQVDDILISSPDGDVLLNWDMSHDSEWDDNRCMLIQKTDNMKEIGNIKTNLIALKSLNGEAKTVYLTAQIN